MILVFMVPSVDSPDQLLGSICQARITCMCTCRIQSMPLLLGVPCLNCRLPPTYRLKRVKSFPIVPDEEDVASAVDQTSKATKKAMKKVAAQLVSRHFSVCINVPDVVRLTITNSVLFVVLSGR